MQRSRYAAYIDASRSLQVMLRHARYKSSRRFNATCWHLMILKLTLRYDRRLLFKRLPTLPPTTGDSALLCPTRCCYALYIDESYSTDI